MNLLKPQILKIGNRRYRKNPFILSPRDDVANQINEPYQEETVEMFMQDSTTTKASTSCKLNNEYDDEACCIEDSNGIHLRNGAFQCTMEVSENYFGLIIGRNGERKSTLERETSTRIKIPQRNNKGPQQCLTIEGKSKSSVASCRNRLNIIISTARHKNPSTHFLSVPLCFDSFKSKLNEFREKVVKQCGADRGVDTTIFQNENKLHLTICTLTLLGDAEVDQAYYLLEDCRKTFIKDLLGSNTGKLEVHIKGLEYMNDDPSMADVIYAKVNPVSNDTKSLDILQSISDKLMNTFVQAGLSKRQYDVVKLHATVINTLMRKDQSNSANQDKERESFDARNVLKEFGDFDFGYYTLKEIHLSVRFSSNNTGYYEYVSKIGL